MSRTIEAELHEILLDIAPDMHEMDEQSVIIAEAAAIFSRHDGQAARTARKRQDEAKVREARLTDSLLQAMGALADWSGDEEEIPGYVDATGLSPDQVVHRACTMRTPNSPRYSSKGFGSGMDIIDDADLDFLLSPPGQKADEIGLEDDELNADLFKTPGRGRHRTDFLNRC